MILYLDSSALVKFYVAEQHSELVATLIGSARRSCISLVGYAEVRAALARRRREGALTQAALDRVLGRLATDWSAMTRVVVDDELARGAGLLADRYALRGFDAIHLASALRAGMDADQVVSMLTFDLTLGRAAALVGLHIPERG